ncbi:MAG: SWIM zinc finger family protein [Aestuariivirga sp.]|uniref:SWIM zinc finger family protein n=1 Tax=Aestuariivirga sp. TaxID=2650926 RepID=UPI00301AB21C
MSYFRWKATPTVAEKRRQAEKRLAKLSKTGGGLSPVVLEGRKIATSFWGKAWCENLERYSDYANRLPRGRSYVRHSCVIDLEIGKGEISAQVSGSSLYRIKIIIASLDAKTWNDICRDCSASIDSMVELLQGRLSKSVMDRVCRPADGLFPAPKSIRMSCSCPDGAYMCKHVAAALYGVGARLDSRPELLFLLRGVDQRELIAQVTAAPATPASSTPFKSDKVLGGADLSALFGLDLEEPETLSKDNNEPDPRKQQKPISSQRQRKTTKSSEPSAPPKPGKKAAATQPAASRKTIRRAALSTKRLSRKTTTRSPSPK